MKLILAILLLSSTSFAEQVSPLSQSASDFFPAKLVNTSGSFYDAGGTQYSDGDVRGSATGSLLLGDDGTLIQSVKVDSNGRLQIDVISSALPSGGSTAANQATANGYLVDIKGYIDQLEGYVDGLESALATLNAKDFSTSAKQDTGNNSLSSIDGKFTTLNAKDFATSAKQDTIIGHVDGLETLVTSTNTKLDSQITQATSTNTKLDTVIGHVDGIEGLITSTNTKLDTGNGYLGSVDSKLFASQKYVADTLVGSDSVELDVEGMITAKIIVTGTVNGVPEVSGSFNGTTYPANGYVFCDPLDGLTSNGPTLNTDGLYHCDVSGFKKIKVFGSFSPGSLDVIIAAFPTPMGIASPSNGYQNTQGFILGSALGEGITETDMGSGVVALDVNVKNASIAVTGTVAVTGVSTASNQTTEITSLQLLDDVVATTGSAIPSKGNAISGTDGTNARVIKTDSSGELQIDVLTLPSITGTVTSNAGTNLNTSLLALESGGNLATAVASLSVMDDWDESDRAKVNLIVGQSGIQGGAGAVSANTQRIAIATDANAVAATLAAETTKVIGTVNQGTSPWVTSFTQPALVAGTALIGKVGIDQTTPGTTNAVSLSHIGSTAVATGNGVVGAGVQRVAIASDNTTFPVTAAATLASETTKVIGTVNIIGGQTSITAGAGAVAANTPRVTIASDDPVVTSVQLIDDAIATNGSAVPAKSMQASGTDGTNARAIAVDSSGVVLNKGGLDNSIALSLNESVAAPTAAVWYLKRQWSPPASTFFRPSRIESVVTTAGSRTFVGVGRSLGTLNTGTNAFAATSSVASPNHYSKLVGCVTTVLSAASDNITITYTDDLGNTGHATGAITFAASSPVGNCYEFTFATTTGQMTDNGVRAVTNITDSAATTGIITVYGMNAMHDAFGVANAFETSSFDNSAVTSAESIFIMLQQAATTAQQRGVTVVGSISAR